MDKPRSVRFPLVGEWQFLRPPGHHQFAFDFVRLANGRLHDAGRLQHWFGSVAAERYPGWGQPVAAPVAGVVLHCAGDWPDHLRNSLGQTMRRWYHATYRFRPKPKDGFYDIRPNAGNYVMIQTEAGYVVFLAHLKQHSVAVTPGDVIQEGQYVGRVGNSGNSTAPHLHINLFDQMDDALRAQVLPFVFHSFQESDGRGAWVDRFAALPAVKSLVRSVSDT
ncbi:MAG: M23 family metallopeptidase [Pseudomonadota bacterium]